MLSQQVFFLFLGTFLLLMWLGPKPTDPPYVLIGQILTLIYFSLLLIGIPLAGLSDSYLLNYKQ